MLCDKRSLLQLRGRAAGRWIYGNTQYREERYMLNDKKNRSFAAFFSFCVNGNDIGI